MHCEYALCCRFYALQIIFIPLPHWIGFYSPITLIALPGVRGPVLYFVHSLSQPERNNLAMYSVLRIQRKLKSILKLCKTL